MIVLKNEQPWGVDIDDTLLLWDAPKEELLPTVSFIEPYTKRPITVAINENNIQLMREKKARGCAIVLWSQGGHEYVEAVAKALGIDDIVDIAMGKVQGVIDDLPCTSWMPVSVNIPYNRNYKKSR